MTTQKNDPKNPLFRKMIQNQFRAFIFTVPSVIGVLFIIISLNLPFGTVIALILCCTMYGHGLAYFFYAGDLKKELNKEHQKNSSQV